MSMRAMVIGVVLIVIISVLGLGIFLQVQSTRNPIVVTNEVILPKGPGNYMEVRHIVLRVVVFCVTSCSEITYSPSKPNGP